MIPVRGFEGKTVAVFGLARTGLAAARALVAGGAQVALWDEKPASREAAAAEGFPLVDLAAADWSQFAALMLSPGVPLTHPAPHWTVEKARAAGVEIERRFVVDYDTGAVRRWSFQGNLLYVLWRGL